MRLTKAQVTGLFEFPKNDSSLSNILANELKAKKRRGTKKKSGKQNIDFFTKLTLQKSMHFLQIELFQKGIHFLQN